MALVNPNIAMSFKPTTEYQPRNVLADFANLQKIQSEQMEMAKLKREENTQNALANAYSQSVDPTGAIDYNKLTGLLATGGGGKEIPTVQKARRELETAELTNQKTSFEVQKAQNEFIAQAQRDTSQNPSDANITAYKEDLIANPLFDDAQKQKLIAGADQLLAMPVDQRRLVMSSRGASASELKPTTQMINRGGRTDVVQIPAFGGAPVPVGTYADVPLPPDVAAQEMQIKAAGKSTNPPAVQPPVAVVGPNGKPMFVSREQAIREGMTPAAELPKLTKDFQWDESRQEQTVIPGSATDKKLRASVAKEISNKKVVDDTLNLELQNIDKLIGDEAGKTFQHKGLSGVFGTVASVLPTFRQNVGNAEVLVDSLASKASINSLLTIRGQGSAIGSITEKEWPRLEGMKAALGKKQSVEEYVRNLKDYRAELLNMKRNVNEEMERAQSGLDEISPSQRQPKAGGGVVPAVGTVQEGYRYMGGNPADSSSWRKQ